VEDIQVGFGVGKVESFCEDLALRGTTIPAVFLGPAGWEEGRVVFRRSTWASKEKPGMTPRASQSMKQEEVRPHAHFVAENRHRSGDDQDEAHDP
jgi:hypothetical protein